MPNGTKSAPQVIIYNGSSEVRTAKLQKEATSRIISNASMMMGEKFEGSNNLYRLDYHNRTHLEYLTRAVKTILEACGVPDDKQRLTLIALFGHDLIFDCNKPASIPGLITSRLRSPKRGDNEERSAQLILEMMRTEQAKYAEEIFSEQDYRDVQQAVELTRGQVMHDTFVQTHLPGNIVPPHIFALLFSDINRCLLADQSLPHHERGYLLDGQRLLRENLVDVTSFIRSNLREITKNHKRVSEADIQKMQSHLHDFLWWFETQVKYVFARLNYFKDTDSQIIDTPAGGEVMEKLITPEHARIAETAAKRRLERAQKIVASTQTVQAKFTQLARMAGHAIHPTE